MNKNYIEKFRITLSRLIVIIFSFLFYYSSSYWEIYVPWFGLIMFFFGVFLVSIATVGRMWCCFYISGYKNNKLVIAGPYSMTRNPLYFFSFLGAIGIGFITKMFFFVLCIFAFFIIYYRFVILSEETRLLELYPIQFKNYKNLTPRFFPQPKLFFEPDEYVAKPPIFRKNLFDVIWFILAIAIVEIINKLHILGVIKTKFVFY